jgi:hypothetical protein
VNNVNDQLDAIITVLLIFESAKHVSGNLLPIFRSVRLWLQQCGVLPDVVVGWSSGVRRRSYAAAQSYAPEDGQKIARNMFC